MSPSRLIGQVHRLAEKADLRVVPALSGEQPYNCFRLIESRVDFIVPGSQRLAPTFLISLCERDSFPPVSLSAGEQLSSPAQAVLVATPLRPDLEKRGIPMSAPRAPLDLARGAGCSRMTASRVARELVAANLVSAQRPAPSAQRLARGTGTSLRFLKTCRPL